MMARQSASERRVWTCSLIIGPGHRKPHRLRAGGEQQPVVGDACGAGEAYFAPRAVDAGDVAPKTQLDAVFGIVVVGPQRQPVLRRAAGEIVFRQIGPVNRRRRVGAQHDDAAAIVAPPQHLGSRKTGRAAADDDDPRRRLRRRAFAPRLRLLALFGDEYAPVTRNHLPARDRAQGRRPHRFAGAQIEARVMPGTAHALADDEAVGKRTVIVGAMGADREHLGAAADEQNLLGADMA